MLMLITKTVYCSVGDDAAIYTNYGHVEWWVASMRVSQVKRIEDRVRLQNERVYSKAISMMAYIHSAPEAIPNSWWSCVSKIAQCVWYRNTQSLNHVATYKKAGAIKPVTRCQYTCARVTMLYLMPTHNDNGLRFGRQASFPSIVKRPQ